MFGANIQGWNKDNNYGEQLLEMYGKITHQRAVIMIVVQPLEFFFENSFRILKMKVIIAFRALENVLNKTNVHS